MAIKVSTSDEKTTTPQTGVKVTIQQPDIKVKIGPESKIMEFKLNARKALNGDIMIFDHADIDIIIKPKKKKIVAFAKDIMSEVVYGAETRLFEFLRKKGIIEIDSIQGGNIYGSLEGLIMESDELDPVKVSLYNISNWMEEERPYFDSTRAYDEMMDDQLLNPDEEESTELGEVPHEEKKGSLVYHSMFAPYLYGRYTY